MELNHVCLTPLKFSISQANPTRPTSGSLISLKTRDLLSPLAEHISGWPRSETLRRWAHGEAALA